MAEDMVRAELADLAAWCEDHAATLAKPTDRNPTGRNAATDVVWGVIDEIRGRIRNYTKEG